MKATGNQNMRRLWNWGRLVLGLVGLGLVVFAVSEEDNLLDTLLAVDLGYVFIAFVLTLGATIIKTVRWWLVLQQSHVNIGFQRLFGTYLVGTFFSQFMPGSSMGGDAMRMVETSVDTGRAVTSVSSVLVERAMGLITIAVSASIILILAPHEDITGTLAWWVIHGLAIIGVVGLVILRMGWFVEPVVHFTERIKLGAVGKKLEALSEALQGQLGESKLMFQMIVLSFLANAGTLTAAYISMLALGETKAYFAFIPLAALAVTVELIPVSPGALGLREAAYVIFLGILNITEAVALSTALLVRAIGWVIGIAGGFVFLARALDPTTPTTEIPRP